MLSQSNFGDLKTRPDTRPQVTNLSLQLLVVTDGRTDPQTDKAVYTMNYRVADSRIKTRNGPTDHGRMDQRTDVPTDRRTNGRTDVPTDGWTDGRTGGCTNGRTDGRTNGPTDGRTDRRMDRRTDQWMDGPTDGWTKPLLEMCGRI